MHKSVIKKLFHKTIITEFDKINMCRFWTLAEFYEIIRYIEKHNRGVSMTETLDFRAFGKNDIRGIYGEDVTEELFYFAGRGYIKFILENLNKNADERTDAKDLWVSVARDARTHSQSLTDSLIKGVTSTGANVLNIGMVPTPLGYYSEFAQIPSNVISKGKINGALIVTASHNPSEYNGLKMTFDKGSLTEEQIKEVKKLSMAEVNARETSNRHGIIKKYDIIEQYTESIVNKFASVGRGIKVVTDCGNATAGVVAPQLYRDLGCEVVELFTEPDGTFPNHHPNPSDEKTLDVLKKTVVEEKADIGIAFDGDSDRIGLVDSKGNALTGDKLLLIYAQDIVEPLAKRGECPCVVSEVKCSQVLYDTINAMGGNAIMTKTGHGYIKSKMKEENAILAGEMSGHTFFKDRYYGFDDAIYAGCRIIEIIAKQKACNPDFKIEDMLRPFEGVCTSKEVRFRCPNEFKKSVLEDMEKEVEKNPDLFGTKIKDIITLDGMRIILEDGFAMIRQSNTEPVFTLRFEAKSEQNCKHYEDTFVDLLDKTVKKYC